MRILAVILCGFVASVSAAINAPVASGARVEPPIFANKVWKVEGSSSIEAGMLEVFVADGTLLIASANGTPSLGAWRTEGSGLDITEEGITYRADILKSTQHEFWIKIHNPGGITEVRFVRAISSECKNCEPTMEHAVRGTVTYRERIALPPGAIVDEWITDVSPLIMIQSIVAETTVPTDGRQVPIPFELSYDPKKIIPDHTYALKAAILSGGEILFTTANGVHVITKENPTHVNLVLVNALASPGH